MIAVSVCQSVRLSRGLSRLHCAKMTEQITMLFVVNTHRGPWNTVLDVSPDPSTILGPLVSPERLKLQI